MKSKEFVSRTALLFFSLCSCAILAGVGGQSWSHATHNTQNLIDVFASEFEGLRDCPIGVPDEVLNDCIQLVFQDVGKFISNGAPSLGIPPFDPLRYDEVTVPLSTWAPWLGRRVQLVLRNLELRGLANYTNPEVRINTKEKALSDADFFPEIRFSFQYELTLGTRSRRKIQGRVAVQVNDLRFNHTTYVRYDEPSKTLQATRVEADSTFGEIQISLPDFERTKFGKGMVAFLNRSLKLARPILNRYSKFYLSPLILAILQSDQFQPVLKEISYYFIPYVVPGAPANGKFN